MRAQVLSVQGKAKIQGDVVADEVVVEGVTRMAGRCEAKHNMSLHGRVTIGGDVKATSIWMDGSHVIEGQCSAQEVKLRGNHRISEGVFAESLSLTGALCVGGSCETERFEAHGVFVIDGLLSADEILVRLERNSRVKEIGGAQIRVVRSKGSRFFQRARRLTAEVIEGDDIYLEYTKADVVRGKRVTLGPGTEVNLLEYSSDFEKIGDAFVGRHKKL